jgi:hypothetical protein
VYASFRSGTRSSARTKASEGQHVHSVLLLQRSDEGPFRGQIHAGFCTCVDGYIAPAPQRSCLTTLRECSISGVCSHVRAMILMIRKTWDVTHEEYEKARLAGLGKDDKRCTWVLPRKKAVHRFLRITGQSTERTHRTLIFFPTEAPWFKQRDVKSGSKYNTMTQRPMHDRHPVAEPAGGWSAAIHRFRVNMSKRVPNSTFAVSLMPLNITQPRPPWRMNL